MTPARILALFVVLALAVVAVAFGLGAFHGDPALAPPSLAADAGKPVAAAPEVAAAPVAPTEDAPAVDASARVAVEAATDPALPALTGRVADEKGAGIAGATVRCRATPRWQPDEDTGESFDPEAYAKRAQEAGANVAKVVSDADGRFRIVPPGKADEVMLEVDARGYREGNLGHERPRDRDVDVGAITLARGAVVSGRVVDRQGNPIARARVRRDGGKDLEGFALAFDFGGDAEAGGERWLGKPGVTDADGRFELTHVEPGEFTLVAKHADHPNARSDKLQVRAGETRSDVLIVAEPGATIAGRVIGAPADKDLLVWARAKKAVGGAEADNGGQNAMAMVFGGDGSGVLGDVGVGEFQAKVAADGAFVLHGLAVGRSYQLWATARRKGFGIPPRCSPQVEAPSGATGIELRYEEGIAVTCRVIDSATGAPIEKLWVKNRMQGGGMADFLNISFGPDRVRDCPDGRVTVDGLRPKGKQTLTLSIAATGYAGWKREGIALPATGTVDLGTIRLDAAPTLRVTVLEAASGKPIRRARVRVEKAGGGNGDGHPTFDDFAGEGQDTLAATTDADGRCTVNAPAGESIVMRVNAKEFAPSTGAALTAPMRGQLEQEVRLLRGGAVVVTVVDASGTPQPKVGVERRGPGGSSDDQNADADGVARFLHLEPGEHTFRIGRDSVMVGEGADLSFVVRADGATESAAAQGTKVTVVDGQEVALQLQREPKATVHGIVRENGAALEGARVAFVRGGSGSDAQSQTVDLMVEHVFSQFGGGGASGNVRTDVDGEYKLDGVAVGEHRLRVTSKSRAMPAFVPVTLRAGDNTVDIDLETASLRGVVRGPDGAPVAGARVRAIVKSDGDQPGIGEMNMVAEALGSGAGKGRDGEATTGADGTFELAGVEPERDLIVEARAKGMTVAKSAPVRVARGGTTSGIEIALGAGGAIEVRVAEAQPFVMAIAKPVGGNDGKGKSAMLRGNSVTLDGLAPGSYEVRLDGALDEASKPAPRTVEVRAGATVTVDFP